MLCPAKNVGPIDRIIRAVLGLGAAIGAIFASGFLQIVLVITATVLIITAITGFCGLYALLRIKT